MLRGRRDECVVLDTVAYHLREVFSKLGITSRSQLDRVLPSLTLGTETPEPGAWGP